MYEHECESDEDCEVYFLKPVNEYNIVDKIKEANRELFGDAAPNEIGEPVVIAPRKVTFALNLEDYEPTHLFDREHEDEQESTVEAVVADELQQKLSQICKFPIIDEESNSEVEDADKQPDFPADTTPMESTKENATEIQNDSKENIDDLNEVLEEICEEIVVMDMESDKPTATTSSISLDDETAADANDSRRMLKQATFDYDEPDNKSMINLLTSDGEEEACFESLGEDEYDHEDIDDEDDQLSIIVASYIPDDFEINPSFSPSQHESTSTGGTAPSSITSLRRGVVRPRKIMPFSRRFTFPRKATICNNSNSTCNQCQPTEVTDLKLHYKTCCEYRNAGAVKLPKYTGYLSEYGLSREQLQRREEKLQKKQRFVLEQTLKTNEQKMLKMQDNERAFTRWLKNKMRFPINKTRNMFDIKLRGGCGARSVNVASGKSK